MVWWFCWVIDGNQPRGNHFWWNWEANAVHTHHFEFTLGFSFVYHLISGKHASHHFELNNHNRSELVKCCWCALNTALFAPIFATARAVVLSQPPESSTVNVNVVCVLNEVLNARWQTGKVRESIKTDYAAATVAVRGYACNLQDNLKSLKSDCNSMCSSRLLCDSIRYSMHPEHIFSATVLFGVTNVCEKFIQNERQWRCVIKGFELSFTFPCRTRSIVARLHFTRENQRILRHTSSYLLFFAFLFFSVSVLLVITSPITRQLIRRLVWWECVYKLLMFSVILSRLFQLRQHCKCNGISIRFNKLIASNTLRPSNEINVHPNIT